MRPAWWFYVVAPLALGISVGATLVLVVLLIQTFLPMFL